jgi:hypothetical protein
VLFITRLVGVRHPPTFDDHVPLSRSQRGFGVAAIIIFVLVFMPVPLSVPEWNDLLIDTGLKVISGIHGLLGLLF